MKALTIPEEKYFVAFVKLKIMFAKGIFYFTGVTPHQISSLHKGYQLFIHIQIFYEE
jgi:aspartate/tyrosine/aromatic aminotransferase